MSNPLTILYIEDDASNRKLVSKLLKASNYNVVEAVDGLSGIDVAKRTCPNLILMDMNMPELDGYEAATRIKNIPELNQIPIVAVTANVTEGDRQRSLVAGCDGYITKPIDIDTFVSEIESYMQGTREKLDVNEENTYLKAYGDKLAVRLENKVRELTDINVNLEQHVEEKIKELNKAQDMLLQSEKMASIGQLAAGVAHEINNPIGFVGSNLSTLSKNITDILRLINACDEYESYFPQNAKDALNKIKEEIDLDYLKDDIHDIINESLHGIGRVKKIVQDLKDFSHVDSAEWTWVNIHDCIDSTLNIASNEIKYKAEIIKEYAELPEIECIASQINQVILNLLVNAAHAIKNRGTITIKTSILDADSIRIDISDTGHGIEEEHVKRIFEPFFTTKPVGKGTGLGLSLAYGIITKHKGKIRLVSEMGKGTTFMITLPVRRRDDED